MRDLSPLCRRIRGRLVEMSYLSRLPHLGGALSCVDILVSLYFEAARVNPLAPGDAGRDRVILSKGHAGSALYATLAERGFFPVEQLQNFGREGSPLPEHPSPWCVPGVEFASGSLGHGLSVGLGLALGARITGVPFRCFVVLSDGECNEGAVWEAAMLAPQLGLDNLVAVVDYNKWQATGRSDEVLAPPSLAAKWAAFRWDVREVDGHDLSALATALQSSTDGPPRPKIVIAHTVKGKGVSFMEDDNNWHYRIPSADELTRAREELQLQ
jgi:transketolase